MSVLAVRLEEITDRFSVKNLSALLPSVKKLSLAVFIVLVLSFGINMIGPSFSADNKIIPGLAGFTSVIGKAALHKGTEQEKLVVNLSKTGNRLKILNLKYKNFLTSKKPVPVASRGAFTRGVREIYVTATAYTFTGHRTATGIVPHKGVVAVDPGVIPLGTKLYVEGYGIASAQDTGGLIKGNKIDVFMETHREAVEWGRKKVKIYILD